MAGRKSHIQGSEAFEQFIQSIPEDSRGRGYWHIKREGIGNNGGGVMQSIMGWLEFNPGEEYDTLRGRIKESFAEKKGPGVYFAVPCDQDRKPIKNVDKARFEFKESEVEMPEAQTPESNPLGDTLKTVKKMSSDMAALQSLDLQQKILNKYLGTDKDKKEEDSVKEAAAGQPNSMNDFLMWKMLMDDGGKKKDHAAAAPEAASSTVQQQLLDSKLQLAMAEMKSMIAQAQPKEDRTEKLLEKLLEAQMKPKEDDRVTRLLEKMIEQQAQQALQAAQQAAQPKGDDRVERLLEKVLERDTKAGDKNAFESMMAMSVKQQEERDRARSEEQRLRDTERAEGEKRRLEEERRRENERKEAEKLRLEEERRKDDAHKEEERRKEEERKEERHRTEDERKGERGRADEQIKLEKQKFEEELKEQRRRFDEEMKFRREEMKHDEEKARIHGVEQQKLQFQLLDMFKGNKDSSLELVTKITDTMTNAGLTSMKTAQEAAESIIEIAKSAHPREKDKSGGIGEIIRDMGQIAAPLLAPYADADAKLKMFQQAQKMQAGARKASRMQPPPMPPRPQPRPQVQPQPMPMPQQPQQEAQVQAQPEAIPVEESLAGTSSNETNKETAGMIAQYLQAYPIVKEALIGNLRDKVGHDIFVDLVLGLEQDTLNGLLASLPPQAVMREIKRVCAAEDQKLIDENEAWFVQLRKEIIEAMRDAREESEGEAAPEPAKK